MDNERVLIYNRFNTTNRAIKKCYDYVCLSQQQDETPGMESDATESADESEDVDILSDFVPSESNLSQSNEASTSAKPSDATDSEGHTGFLTTFDGDHNYCCTSAPTTEQSAQETEESEQEAGHGVQETVQSVREGGQSGHESSPKVIIESQHGEQVCASFRFFPCLFV